VKRPFAAFVFCAVASAATAAQAPCPRAVLPAYAHNDYENDRPLFDALRLGYQGVEADVFLVDGVLRVGHDRRRAMRSGTLEQMYLQPLKELSERCHWLVAENEPFLLNVELKEASEVSFDSLLALLGRYGDVLSYAGPDSTRERTTRVTFVGWHPPLTLLTPTRLRGMRLQHRLTRPEDSLPRGGVANFVWMVSVDYGKSIAGWWRSRAHKERWLRTLRGLAMSGRTIRVYNVPVDAAVYRQLLAAGVSLIGTETLDESREPLLSLVNLSRCYSIEAGPWTIPKDAHDRTIPAIPSVVVLDSVEAEGIFESSSWRRVNASWTGSAPLGPPWAWHSGIGSLSLSNSSGFGGLILDFRIAGDSIYGRARVFSDVANAKHPFAPARGRSVPCN